MSEAKDEMTIGGLAHAAGVNVETVRYYQRRGLVRVPQRARGGIRRYGDDALGRIRFVRAAQRLGFSLDEVAELLGLDDGADCDVARAQAEEKLAEVRGRIADLKRVEKALAGLVSRCERARGTVRCPLIEALRAQ